MTDFKPIKSFETMEHQVVKMIADSLGATGSLVVNLGDVDLEAGCGIIGDYTRCMWTKEGHRIEVWVDLLSGAYGASKSKEIDPFKPVPK